MLKVVILTLHDFASSGYEIKEAVKSISDNIDVKLVKMYQYKYAVKGNEVADAILTNKGVDSREIQKWLKEADIIHLKGDEYPDYNWYNLEIPRNRPIILTAGGSRFRTRVGNAHPNIVRKYTRIPDFITTITPDLNYDWVNGYYTQHSINSTVKENEFIFDSYPIISHSPSDRSVKNTRMFMKVMDKLKREGYKFEVDVIEKVSNEECINRKLNSQIFFDQAKIPFYGKSAVEAMQYGIPVVSYVSDASLQKSNRKIDRKSLPVVNSGCTEEFMYKAFKDLIERFNNEEFDYILDLSYRTKEWCDKFHSYPATGKMWESIYYNVLERNKLNNKKFFRFGQGVDPNKNNFKVKNKVKHRDFDPNAKLLFFSKKGASHFAQPYIDNIGGVQRYNEERSNKVFEKLMKESSINDFIWFEWGGNFTKNLLNKYDTEAKVIVRLHDWEIRSGLVKEIDMHKVSVLWFINKEFRKDFFNQVNVFKPSFYLPNTIDTKSFNFRKKVYGKNIVGIAVKFSKRKNFLRLVELFGKVIERDRDFKLYIKAPVVDSEGKEELRNCYNKAEELGINDKISWDTWEIDYNKLSIKDDIDKYLDDKDFIISTSNHEGFHCTIGESMAKGLHPYVYKWEKGSPEQFWSNFVFDNLDDMADSIVDKAHKSNKEQLKLGKYYRKYVEDNYSPENLSKDLVNSLFYKRKILFVTHNHLYKYNARGAEKSLKIIVDYLYQVGYQVIVVNHNMKRYVNFNKEWNDGVLYYDIPADRLSGNKGFFSEKLDEIIKEEKPDLAFSYAIAMKESYDVLRKNKIPYILLVRWFRLINPLPPGDLMTRGIDKNFIKDYRKLFDNADSIITNNKYSVDVIKRFYGVDSDYSYVPYFGKEKNLKVNKDGYIILITPNKDLLEDELLDYLSYNMPNENFLAINAPSRKQGKTRNNLEYIGYSDNINNIYSQAKALLYPVYNNDVCGTSRVIVEAQSYGLPIICNRRSGINEKISDDFTVSKNASFEEWVDKIEEFNTDLLSYKKLALDDFRKYDSYSQLDVYIENINNILRNKK